MSTSSVTEADALRDHCRNQLAPMLQVLRQLVDENSYSRNPEGGARVADLLSQQLGAIDGISVQMFDSERFAPHLMACTEAAKDSADGCIALVGHHDTVFPPGGFEGFTQEGDIARGPGVLDMKSGLTLMVFALRCLAVHDGLNALPIRMISVSDEEIGSPEGAEIIAQQLRGAACALVFEAGRKHDAIITRRKGSGGIKAIARGQAAHAGNHHRDGANAIWALAQWIQRAQAFTDYEQGVTVNVGMVQGGEAKNTVPDYAEATVDIRYLQKADGHAVVARMRQAAEEAAVPGTTIEIQPGVFRSPLERNEANLALFREYAACAKAAGLGHGEAPLIGGGSDASTTSAMGIPSIDGLGPRGSGFHTKNELIEVSSMVNRLEALVRFLFGRQANSTR